MHYPQCYPVFFVITIVITKYRNYGKQNRTEQEWTALFDATVTSIIGGRCANDYFGDYSIDSIISEAIRGADLLIKELKEREVSEN